MSVYITGCEKDQNILSKSHNDQIFTRSVTNEQPTQEEISNAKQLFYSQINDLSTVNDSGPLLHIWNEIIPVWDESKVVIFETKRLIATPTINGMNQSNLQLIYFKNNDNEKSISIIGFWEETSGQSYDNFSGSIFDVNTNGFIDIGTELKNGRLIGFFRNKINENAIGYRGDEHHWLVTVVDWQEICNSLKCDLRGPECECRYDIFDTDHGVPLGTNKNSSCPAGEHTGTLEVFHCVGNDCQSWNDEGGLPDLVDPNGDGLEESGYNNGGSEVDGGSGDSGGNLDNDLTDLISTLLDGVNPSYKPCNKEREFDGYQPFAAQTMDYDDYLNLQADAIFSMWGNNTGISLVNAILSSNGDLANAIYNQVNPQNDFEYDQNNPIHQAVLQAVQDLISNINNANGDCNSIMNMADFINLLNDLVGSSIINNSNLNQEEKDYALNNSDIKKGVTDFYLRVNGDDKSKYESIEVIIKLIKDGYFYGPYDEEEKNTIIPTYFSAFNPNDYVEFLTWVIILKSQREQPCIFWCEVSVAAEAYWKTIKGKVHNALDVLGLIPGVGEPFDLVNGVMYTIEGDGVNAALSYAAVLPLVGSVGTVGKIFKRVYEVGNEAFELTYKIGTNLYEFGSRGKLKSLLKPGATEQCRHIITWASNSHEIIQLAAKEGWHPSHIKNGINLDKSIHNGYNAAHQIYSQNLKNYLDNLIDNNLISNSEGAKSILISLQKSIRQQLENGKLLDQITFP